VLAKIVAVDVQAILYWLNAEESGEFDQLRVSSCDVRGRCLIWTF